METNEKEQVMNSPVVWGVFLFLINGDDDQDENGLVPSITKTTNQKIDRRGVGGWKGEGGWGWRDKTKRLGRICSSRVIRRYVSLFLYFIFILFFFWVDN